ncbi:protoglobin domain-containing protein [Rhodobium orientis]|uniref:protoglobin domain-containing protein n=1 Tax=Rhodobium orientis TaxID=34017 RepID=UPI001A92CDCC
MRREHIDIWANPDDITTDVRDRLWFFISRDVDMIMDKFYARINKSNLSYLLNGVDLERLKEKQKSHWRRLILYRMDENYDLRLKNMHAYHVKVGLHHGHYISGYFMFMNLFQKSILKRVAGPKQAYEMIVALQSIISEDITRALGVNNYTAEDTA